VKNRAKTISSRSTRGRSSRLAQLFGAFASHGAPGEIQGVDAPTTRSAKPRLAVLATLAAVSAVVALTGGAATVYAANPPSLSFFELSGISGLYPMGEDYATRAVVVGRIAGDGLETNWRIEYAAHEEGPWTLAREATESPAADQNYQALALISHLAPETKYYARLNAKTAAGNASKTISFITTAVGAPEISTEFDHGYDLEGGQSRLETVGLGFSKIGTTFASAHTQIETDGAETAYQFEYAASAGGPWTVVPGGGLVTVAEELDDVEGLIEGLAPETPYFIRVRATNEKGTTITSRLCADPCSSAGEEKGEFKTDSVRPVADVPVIQSVGGSSVHVEGSAYTGTYETHWLFEYAPSEGGPWSPVPGGSGTITAAEAEKGYAPGFETSLAGLSPSKQYYVRLFAENVNGVSTSKPVSFETGGAPLVETFAVHALHGEAIRVLGAVTPDGFDTRYHFEYVAREQFEAQGGEGGFARAQRTPELDAGVGESRRGAGNEFGFPTVFVGQDVPSVEPGKTYEYRIVATSSAPGDPEIAGSAQTLTVPAAVESSVEGQSAACPNEQFRSGLSAHLADCRAYELVTPVDKEGAFEAFGGLPGMTGGGALVGEDGEHAMIASPGTHWGSGQSPYFFSRTPTGWQMTAATVQPEAGIDKYKPASFGPDLTSVSLLAGWQTAGGTESSEQELKVGAPGGPYTTVPGSADEVANSEDFSNLVLSSEDRTLVAGHRSATTSGGDLYEYSGGRLRQANVLTGGAAIGTCGATIANGAAEYMSSGGQISSRHSVSADGSRVLFLAVPGSDCSEPKHLYMRVGGSETLDVGAYTLLAANAEGTTLLLEKRSGATSEIFLYDVQARAAKLLFAAQVTSIAISEDFNAIYLSAEGRLDSQAPSGGGLYRYDIPTETLTFVLPGVAAEELTPDGRYVYFQAGSVAGVPGGGLLSGPPEDHNPNELSRQLYRYDSAEEVVECISCASPFDPEPKFNVEDDGEEEEGRIHVNPINGMPRQRFVSADGDYAFFETAAALVPQDLNGEEAPRGPTGVREVEGADPSYDVYEWRRAGVDGCGRAQGCISLITPGTDGGEVALVGTTATGRDVFFITRSQLVAADRDTAVDLYDARVDGGFPTPVPSVECEGDTCSTPASPPNDATPSSFTFTGLGNVVALSPSVAKPKPRRIARCSRGRTAVHGKCAKKAAGSRRSAKRSKSKSRSAKRSKSKSHRGGK
jgi:hypothetical protein